jgi:hypothetical protein
MVRSRQEKAQTTGMVAIHPYSRIAGLITSTPITRIKATIIKSNQTGASSSNSRAN